MKIMLKLRKLNPVIRFVKKGLKYIRLPSLNLELPEYTLYLNTMTAVLYRSSPNPREIASSNFMKDSVILKANEKHMKIVQHFKLLNTKFLYANSIS